MKIDYEFTVGVPVDQAWSRMLDLEKIAPCLPGAAIQEEVDDGEYEGTMKVEIGPITVSYKGTVKFEETDESAHRTVLQATGREAHGQGTASATIVSTLREEGDGTRVNVETDMMLTGRVAQFGRGLAQDVAKRMLDDFAVCLEREISGGDAAEPAPEVGTATGADNAADAGGTAFDKDPAATAGATVEGAIVAGSGPSEAAAAAPAIPTHQPADQEITRREPPEEPEPLDLDGAGRDAIPKQLPPRARRHRGPSRTPLASPQEPLDRSATSRQQTPVAEKRSVANSYAREMLWGGFGKRFPNPPRGVLPSAEG